MRPAAVAAVPAKIVIAPNPTVPRAHRVSVRSCDSGRSPRSQVARQASATAAATTSIESAKVGHHPAVVERAAHGQPAQHGLCEHAKWQAARSVA